jgi:uncharacterized OB-fold protein
VTAESQSKLQSTGVPGARCNDCGHLSHPRPRHCAQCLGDAFIDEIVPGDGVVYSVTVVRSGRNDRPLPYGLAHVDLAVGLRVMAGFDAVSGDVPEPGTPVVVGQVGLSEAGLPLLQIAELGPRPLAGASGAPA